MTIKCDSLFYNKLIVLHIYTTLYKQALVNICTAINNPKVPALSRMMEDNAGSSTYYTRGQV